MRFVSFTTGKSVFLMILLSAILTSCGEVGKPDFSFGGGGGRKWESLLNEGQTAQDKGKINDAEKSYKEAIEICAKKFGENDGRTATCVGYLAGLYMAKQDWRLAYNETKRWKTIMQEVEPGGEQMKSIEQNMKRIKEKLIQYNLVPDEILKKRAEKHSQEKKTGNKQSGKAGRAKGAKSELSPK